MSKSRRIGRVHLVIPDVQNKPGVPTWHLEALGNYVAEKRPDALVCLGDFADMPSLSSYDVGKAAAEGKRYREDIDCANAAMAKLLKPIKRVRGYTPEMHLTMGNHEQRIKLHADANPRLIGTMSLDDLQYKESGWRAHPFLKVVMLDGVQYAHYFVSGAMGRPVSSAAALLRTRQCSAVMGHVQRLDLSIHPFTQNVALFAGLYTAHDEEYLGEQSNSICKKGIWVLNEVNRTFDPMFVSLEFLRRNYA